MDHMRVTWCCVCLMVFNATFNNISVISWQSNRWRKPEYPEKTTDLSQVMWRKPEYPKKTTNLPQVTDRRNAEDLEKTIDLPRVTDKLYRKPEDPEKTTDLSHVIDRLYHIKLYTSTWLRFELTTSVVIGTDCIGSCKSNCNNHGHDGPTWCCDYCGLMKMVLETCLILWECYNSNTKLPR